MAGTGRDYQSAIQALNSLTTNLARLTDSNKFDHELHRLEYISRLKRVGVTVDQVDALNVIHITGTKGKGSTGALCESILKQHGFRTGFLSSPHLIEERERIRVDGKPLDKKTFAEHFWRVYDLLDNSKKNNADMPFMAGFMVVMALSVFVESHVDVVMLEVGIGGEYDTTNIVRTPVACGITCLDYDHVKMLADFKSISQIAGIAWNKAGIFKRGVPAFTVEQEVDDEDHSGMQMILERSKEKGCPLYVVPTLRMEDLGDTKLGIPGKNQLQNAALAVQLCRVFLAKEAKTIEGLPRLPISGLSELEKKGLSECWWPGRDQTISQNGVTYFLDGAHTPHSIKFCVEWFEEAAREEVTQKTLSRNDVKRICMFSVFGDREVKPLLEKLQSVDVDVVIFCPNTLAVTPASEEKAKAQEMEWRELNHLDDDTSLTCPSIQSALEKVKELGQGKQLIQVLVTGSIHLVGSTLGILSPDAFN